jgi:type III secretion system FlhB-like substrate exporter
MAAVDNAEAVEAAPAGKAPPRGERIAGAVAGVGSAEVARRLLTTAELEQILIQESNDLGEQASRCETLGRHSEAGRLRSQAELIRRYRVAL